MKIVLWGTYDTGKPRIRILCDGLRELGIEIIEIHASVWEDIGDKSELHGTRRWIGRGLRLLLAYPHLLWQYLFAPEHDLVLVSYPGQLDALVLRPLAWLRRKPLVLDWFISAYDTLVHDRRLLSGRNPIAWGVWLGEWLAAHAATLAFMDTATHAKRMETAFRLRSGSVGRVWVGAEASFFGRPARHAPRHPGMLNVLFYGQFIPLHGIDTIIDAARCTRAQPIHWTLVGRGQEAPRIRKLLDDDPLPNVEWIDWITYTDLPEAIADADLCLGIFGTSAKAASVIPNKVFQILASGRPMVTRDSDAMRELFDHPPRRVRLTPAGDALALADAVRGWSLSKLRLPTAQPNLTSTISARAVATQFVSLVSKQFHLK